MRTRTTQSTRGSRSNNQRTNKKSLTLRPAKLAKMLCDGEIWDLPKVKNRNDDFYIQSITGVRTNGYTRMNSDIIRKIRIVTNIDSKLKSSEPLRSDEETIKEFISTQDEPIIGDFMAKMLGNTIDSYFADFDYDGVLAEVHDPDRVLVVTSGAAAPQMLAPVIHYGARSNAALLLGMKVGDAMFEPDFDPRTVFGLAASGVIRLVNKNYKTRRMITLTNREIIDKQLVISNALRDYVTIKSRTSNHIIQFDDQSVQHKLLLEHNCTIDLSSASDRAYVKLLDKAWPIFLEKFEEYLPKDVMTPAGRVIALTCVGTQGYPLTFTLMAILCGLIVQTFKTTISPSSNYGDDIIVHQHDFENVYVALESLGFKINRDKTHRAIDGMLESCGEDRRFTEHGWRNITPVYLRGTSDIEVIQFFTQLSEEDLINPEQATALMDRLGVEYYAFESDHQLTEYHFNFGDIKHVPKPVWSTDKSHMVCSVPQMKTEIDYVRGLSKKESDLVLSLLHIEAGLKDPNINEYTRRGTDLVARQYGIIAMEEKLHYNLHQNLSKTDCDSHLDYRRLQDQFPQFGITFKVFCYYHFITSEMCNYKYSTPTVDFSSYKVHETSYSEIVDQLLGIKPRIKYPIYGYKKTKCFKTILHPKSKQLIGEM